MSKSNMIKAVNRQKRNTCTTNLITEVLVPGFVLFFVLYNLVMA